MSSKRRILFLDRDGTLIVEPQDKQVDSLEKLQLVADVIPALLHCKLLALRSVRHTNGTRKNVVGASQSGSFLLHGSSSFPLRCSSFKYDL